MLAIQLSIQGRVHGVFYRDWTVANARERGLAGWVRNLPDGTVEVILEGEAAAIEDMVAAMHEGPPRARVERIEQSEVAASGLTSFERR